MKQSNVSMRLCRALKKFDVQPDCNSFCISFVTIDMRSWRLHLKVYVFMLSVMASIRFQDCGPGGSTIRQFGRQDRIDNHVVIR